VEREEAERAAWAAPGVTNAKIALSLPLGVSFHCEGVRGRRAPSGPQPVNGGCHEPKNLVPFSGRGNLARPDLGLFGSLQREVDSLFEEFTRGLSSTTDG